MSGTTASRSLSAEKRKVFDLPFCVFGGLNDWSLSVYKFFSLSDWVRILYKGIVFCLRYIAIYCDIMRCMAVSGIHLLYTKNRNVVHGKIEEERKKEKAKKEKRNQSRKKG